MGAGTMRDPDPFDEKGGLMLRNTIRRGGITLALLLALGLGLIGATPAAAQGFRSNSAWEGVWSWLIDLFGLTGSDQPTGNYGGLSHVWHVWEMEGAGFDPYGNPLPTGNGPNPTTNEGAGFDPYGES
jgi:hypothetical protein